ncbi:MAG: hypothetical protein Q7V16_08665 [Hydrogenophaga sp.]|nr:hypothetical protein [Hydrogenophaga sp.]
MLGQPLVYTDSGTVKGCGIRLLGQLPVAVGSKKFRLFDGSANIYREGAALTKMILMDVPMNSNPATAKQERIALSNFWLKAEGKSPAAARAGTYKESPSEKRAYLFAAAVEPTIDFIMGATYGDPVQVGLKWETDYDWVYVGRVELSEEDRTRVGNCFEELTK